MPDITSRQHPLVKTFKDAASGDSRRALLDGWHLLQEAESAGLTIETVLVSGVPPTALDTAVLDRLSETSDVFSVSSQVMDAASPVRTPAGVVALGTRRTTTLGDVLTSAPALVVVAVDIQDPGNVGAIVRSAEAGGATGVVLGGVSADVWGWKALRASMGSTFRLPVVQQRDSLAAIRSLRDRGLRVFATVPRQGISMHEADLRVPAALLLGGEAEGLRAELAETADEGISIPMEHQVESLNVAVATGVLVYEARRQRRAR